MKVQLFFISLIFLFCSALAAQPRIEYEDGMTKLLSVCSDSTPCLVAKCIVFAPIFPWFLYPYDDDAPMYKIRRFERFSGDLDFGLIKANEHNSGYKFGGAFYKRWVGLDISHETYNNGDYDRGFWGAHLVFRLAPRGHLQPKLLIGLRYVTTDSISGGGFEISFFNYDISFTRRFSMFIVNYIGWIKQYIFVEGLLGFEYYVYPTISMKASMDVKHVYTNLLQGVQIGLSIKL